MAEVEVGGRALWVQRQGRGRPLLLLPGMATHSLHWGDAFLGALGEGAQLVLLDHRGTGRSARDRAPFTVVDLAEDAAGALAALGIAQADVLGFSLGGMVAQELALRAPERVRRLVLVGTTPGGPGARGVAEETLAPLLAAMRAHDGEGALRAGWEANVAGPVAGDPEAYARWVQVNVARPFALATLRGQLAAARGHATAERLVALARPTLVVHGTADRVVPPADAELLARELPYARLELIDGAGHLVFWEAPARVAQLVGEHLAA
jgi:pimeloyl-ACP methyl ester carboxylesterase